MNVRKYIGQQEYFGWGEQFPLFKPLETEERQLLQSSPTLFQQKFPAVRLFPDPFLKSAQSVAQPSLLCDAKIIAGSDKASGNLAVKLAKEIAARFGSDLPVWVDTEELDFWTIAEPLILVGGVHQNLWSRRLAQRLQLGVFNHDFPGERGWGVTTYHGIQAGLGPRFVLSTNEEAKEYFLTTAVVADKPPRLQWVHKVHLSKTLPEEFHDFDTWLRQPRLLLSEIQSWITSEPRPPYREIFTKVLLSMQQGPITYSASLLDLGVCAARYFQMTGDEKALHLFREMMWGFWNYLHHENANLYISDLDFRLGQICTLRSWLQFHPAITEEEREIFPLLLLGAMRMAHGYYLQIWSSREMPPGTRHNHQTFKARCLALGWRYFEQLEVADVAQWKQDADAVFEAIDASRIKFTENANRYESFVPEHLLAWHEITGRDITPDFQRALSVFALREWALTDNFFYRAEYGDCDVSFKKYKPFQVGPWLDRTKPAQREIIALEQTTTGQFPLEVPDPIGSFFPTQTPEAKANLDELLTGWTLVPLEPKLQERYPLAGTQEEWFDKLAWRSAWKGSSSYIAIEGFGNRTVSHAHNAANSIIRANFGGRVWLVGNGYGKRIGVTSATDAFRTRELGPTDHNMLVLRDADGEQIVPPRNTVLIDHGAVSIPFAITGLRGYGGCRWRRHTFLLGESGLIVIDSVATEKDARLPHPEYSLEWNLLGEVSQSTLGATIEQGGVALQFQHLGTAHANWEHNASASWHRVMQNHEYPHTSNALKKAVLRPTGNENPLSQHHFVSGFWLEGECLQADWEPSTLVLDLQMNRELTEVGAEYSASWGSLKVDGNSLRVELRQA